MAKFFFGGREFNIIRVALILVALTSLCEARGRRAPLGRARAPLPRARVPGLARGRPARAKDPLAIQASEAIRGLVPGEKVFDATQYGADPTGGDDSSTAIMKAWQDSCHFPGRSRMVVPAGKYLVTEMVFLGGCAGPAAKVVEIRGTLLADNDLSAYSSDYVMLFTQITGLIFIGSGVIDGQGAAVWKYSDCNTNSDCMRMPINLKFDTVSNAIVSRFNSLNSKGFHISVTNSRNMRLYNLKATAPDESPNTDGIHISRSDNIKIANAILETGDDCISMIQGCTNINIKKVKCGPGHGISIGSLGKYQKEQDVSNIMVRNCTLTGTTNGVRIKTWPNSPPSAASKMTFANIVMNNVKNPIIIDQEYNAKGKTMVIPSRVQISDIHFVNIRGTSTSPAAVNVVCSRNFPCRGVHFRNINLRYVGPSAPAPSVCLNTQGLLYEGLQIPAPCR